MALVECVPNISEGRDPSIIQSVAAEIGQVEGATLLDVDPGKATNRTVITFVGDPEAVLEGAFRVIAKAAELIDMSRHEGEHPRMGATDVCPFIPVSDITMDECAELARRLGERVGRELGIPVYLYEHAATSPERANLATIRAGEYEGLAKKLQDPHWKPDRGDAKFNARAGATMIGARKFLIAYNVNLNSVNKALAHDIALNIREAGRNMRGANGKFVRGADGKPKNQPGLFKDVKAVGWYIDEYQRAQISINFTDHEVSPIHEVFEEIRKQAAERGMRVTGSELVGLIPKSALVSAGLYYLGRQGASLGVPESRVIETAIQSLGLHDLGAFDPQEKVIEYRVGGGSAALAGMTVSHFVDEVSSESPAPGGGSVAALCGSLGAALSSMVANLTVGKKGYEDHWKTMSDIALEAQALKVFFVDMIDRDTDAFTGVLVARRLPNGTSDEKKSRADAILVAMKDASMVPFATLEACLRAMDLAERSAKHGNSAVLSDAAVGALCAEAAAESAWFNVLINIGDIDDPGFVSDLRAKADNVLESVRKQSKSVRDAVRKAIESDS